MFYKELWDRAGLGHDPGKVIFHPGFTFRKGHVRPWAIRRICRPVTGARSGPPISWRWSRRATAFAARFVSRSQMFGRRRPVPRWRTVLADGLDNLTMLAVFAIVIDRDDRVRRRDQQQDVEEPAERHARHDQHEVEDRRENLAVEQQRQRRYEDGEDVDHHTTPKIAPRLVHVRSARNHIGTVCQVARSTRAELTPLRHVLSPSRRMRRLTG